MYLNATHIPIFLFGGRRFVSNGFGHALRLHTSYFAAEFGPCILVGSWADADEHAIENLEDVTDWPDLTAIPCVNGVLDRAGRQRWDVADLRRTLAEHVPNVALVTTAIPQNFLPQPTAATRAARRYGVPTVVAGQDMDVFASNPVDFEKWPPHRKWKRHIRNVLIDRRCFRQLRLADLALIKEGLLWDRYAKHLPHARAFCHTVHSSDDVIADERLERRIATLKNNRPLRFVYCGRLVERKGVHVAIQLIKGAADAGSRCEFDIIGDGPQSAELRCLIDKHGLPDRVRLLGRIEYGPDLLNRLGEYDALLFTPIAEDTPRMLYDGYAAGLPLIGTDIPFLKHRADSDHAAFLFPLESVEQGVSTLVRLDRRRHDVAEASLRAAKAGYHHAMEFWYEKRLEWVRETVRK